MFLVDSHCHLSQLNYQTLHHDLADVMTKAEQHSVKHCLAVSTSLSDFKQLLTLTADFKNISLSCGIHPLDINDPAELEALITLANHPRVIALGETGLDYHYQKETIAIQQRYFAEHIDVGKRLQKPIIVHTREAQVDTITMLKQENAAQCGGVIHCFTEDQSMAKKVLDLGFYISLSGIVTFRNAEALRDVVRYIPIDRMLVETDSPYLAPVPYRGKENQPAYTRSVAEYIATLKQVELSDFAKITTDNFCRLFNLTLD